MVVVATNDFSRLPEKKPRNSPFYRNPRVFRRNTDDSATANPPEWSCRYNANPWWRSQSEPADDAGKTDARNANIAPPAVLPLPPTRRGPPLSRPRAAPDPEPLVWPRVDTPDTRPSAQNWLWGSFSEPACARLDPHADNGLRGGADPRGRVGWTTRNATKTTSPSFRRGPSRSGPKMRARSAV